MEKNSIGSFLTALRKANGMTQKELAERLNVSDKAVSRWERDENYPDITQIPVIADIFGITSDELLRGERGNKENAKNKTERTGKEIAHFTQSVWFGFLIRTISAIAVAFTALIVSAVIISHFDYGPWLFTEDARDAWSRETGILRGIASAISWAAILSASFFVVVQFMKSREKLSRLDGEEQVTKTKRKVKYAFLAGGGILAVIFFLNLGMLLK